MMKTWKTEHPSYVLKDRWVTIRADRCLTPQGVRVNPCYVMEALDWVHILALDPENNVLLIRQYRHAAGVLSTEIPCGEIEPEESPVEAGKRELREETGCMAERFQFNGSFYCL